MCTHFLYFFFFFFCYPFTHGKDIKNICIYIYIGTKEIVKERKKSEEYRGFKLRSLVMGKERLTKEKYYFKSE